MSNLARRRNPEGLVVVGSLVAGALLGIGAGAVAMFVLVKRWRRATAIPAGGHFRLSTRLTREQLHASWTSKWDESGDGWAWWRADEKYVPTDWPSSDPLLGQPGALLVEGFATSDLSSFPPDATVWVWK